MHVSPLLLWLPALLLSSGACSPSTDSGRPDPDAATTPGDDDDDDDDDLPGDDDDDLPGDDDDDDLPGDDDDDDDDDNLEWRDANLTTFTSYPEPGSDECENFSGCEYAGHFAFVEGQQSEEWVESHNIAAVHSDDADYYALKTLRVRSGSNEIDVTVYDMCSDDDCNGCCSNNSSETGFLIDLESFTSDRFGVEDGIVEFACLDCE
jgi:hypothetical protein